MEEKLINKEIKHKEKPKRSFAKAVSWRVVGTLTLIIITFSYTSDIQFALNMGVIDVVANMILYFIHERIWNLFDWKQKVLTTASRINLSAAFLRP
ncbi:MAG: DUF2061 domain-containing protein [Candidatus Paceibacteria bacterium]